MTAPKPKPSMADLDAFMTDEALSKVDAIKSLKSAGVDTNSFFDKIDQIVQKGYTDQLRKVAEHERSSESVRPSFLVDLAQMPRQKMLAIFADVSSGRFGTQYRESALARCRNKNANDLTDEELRSWLEDIGEILGEP